MGRLLVWRFGYEHYRLGYGDGREIVVGEKLTVEVTKDRPLEMCFWGLHGSVRAIDALNNGIGPVVERDLLSGEILEGGTKACASERTCLAMADASNLLHELACQWAGEALDAVEKAGYVVDPRSRRAIDTKRRWLRGEAATDEMLNAAGGAYRVLNMATQPALLMAAEVASDAVMSTSIIAARAVHREAPTIFGHLAVRGGIVNAVWGLARDACEATHNAELERRLRELLHLPPSDEEGDS